MSGWWPFRGFPESISVHGVTFEKAKWEQGYHGVIAQYREARARGSRHLFVYEDGQWAIDHVDQYNPDRGYPVEHFLVDHPVGQALTVVLGLGLVVGAGALLVKAAEAA